MTARVVGFCALVYLFKFPLVHSISSRDEVYVLQPAGPTMDLHHAVFDNNSSLVKQLLAEGADPCAKDEKASTICTR